MNTISSYISYNHLISTIKRNLYKIPNDVSLIVGVPRSGMIPVSIIAEYLNKPFMDIDSFIRGEKPRTGLRGESKTYSGGKVYVIDDTCYSGRSINIVREMLKDMMDDYEIYIGCIYLEGENSNRCVDFYFEDIRNLAVNTFGIVFYEWNIFHHGEFFTSHTYYDLDGVMCMEPPDERNVDGYVEYIGNAVPYILPDTCIGAVVTYRLDKYRDITSEWLNKHGVEYGKLIMTPVGSYDERSMWKKSSEYKGEIYRDSDDAYIFVESDDMQAREICMISGKCVYSVGGNCMYNLIDGVLYRSE